MHRLALVSLFLAAFSGSAMAGPIDNAPEEKERVYLISRVLEKAGTVDSTPYTFDTEVLVFNTAGLADGRARGRAGSPRSGETTLSLTLYGDDDAPLRSGAGNEVCNPCGFPLSATQRKTSIRLDDLIVAAGGFDPADGTADELLSGYAVLVVRGPDPDLFAVDAFIVNSHTGPFDLSTSSPCGGSGHGGGGHVTLIK